MKTFKVLEFMSAFNFLGGFPVPVKWTAINRRKYRAQNSPFLRILDSNTVEIRRLSVPRWIQNGTEDSVVLDCDYAYNENDFRLVVKWFFQDNTEPVYQWIPALKKKHISETFMNRIDLNFSVTTKHEYSRYRALKILRPTTELSGKYTCVVTSFAGQDSKEQVMTVFVPANVFDLSYIETSYKTVNVSCETLNVFPFPNLKLYLRPSSTSAPQAVTDVKTYSTQKPSGAFDVVVHRTFLIKELSKDSATVFECILELPGTNQHQSKRIAYIPGIQGSRLEKSHQLSSSHKPSEHFIGKCFISYVTSILFLHIAYLKILIWNT